MARGQSKRLAALLRRAWRADHGGTVPLYDVRGFQGVRELSSLATVGKGAPGSSIQQLDNVQFGTFASGQQFRAISVEALQRSDRFEPRHNGVTDDQVVEMLQVVKASSLDDLISTALPPHLRREGTMDLGEYTRGMSESEFLEHFKEMAMENKVFKSYIGMGYYNTRLPTVIQRNLLENPGWYTQYTPYQAEIAQGRLESLLNFQTMVADLTGMEMSNASLLDEATAAAEAMTMCSAIARGKKPRFLVSDKCHPQTIAVCQSRADGLGLKVEVMPESQFDFTGDVCGCLVQYPATDGSVHDYKALADKAHDAKVKVVAATDLLALTMLKPPGEWGADITIGSAQRFGVPLGYGGPHAAFLATSDEYKRMMPGRIIGMSRDAHGNPCLRMAMQTREQHIRRDKATSNICTAQALLANIAAMYAVYHGPKGLTEIATRCNALAHILANGAEKLGHSVARDAPFFDTICINVGDSAAACRTAVEHGINLRPLDASRVTVAIDETTTLEDVDALFAVLNGGKAASFSAESLAASVEADVGAFKRTSTFMQHPVFNSYTSEHELLRYLKKLENRDLSMVHSMIPLGSCTMKLNATTEMIPVTWNELANIHPFVPPEQAQGYAKMFDRLAQQLCEITGFDSVSLQPNSGASGEYAGLMAIRAYHHSRGDHHRNICIVPTSAHGTNPASAVMCGMKVVTVRTLPTGEVDMEDFHAAVKKHKDNLSAFMITYPSTFGVFDKEITELCETIHGAGGQVYMDGANMNAQVGITAPGIIGADVCHLNLHKTFCIPHGGGGPGMGPIGVRAHLAPFLPSHPVIPTGGLPAPENAQPFGTMAAAPFGSSLILPISFAYISMMGAVGLRKATELSVLHANYMATRLSQHYPILFTNENGRCAHEFILDIRELEKTANIQVDDIAKRLIDYGFHAPTMSWPVPGTLMVEPTESEPKAEMDRFIDAMIAIRAEIREIEEGKFDKENNMLKNAPHTHAVLMADTWDKPYPRERAAYPVANLRDVKFWPTTSRVDNVFGDRNVVARLQSDEAGLRATG